jgi:hypothetical protein
MSKTILHAFRQSPSFSMHGATLRVCPSLVFLALLMALSDFGPQAVIANMLMVSCYLALWLGKLQAQLWMVRRLRLGRAEMHLSPFVAHIILDPNVPRSVQADVHILGLCVLFGAWASCALLAGLVDDMELRIMLTNIAKCALVSAMIAAMPVFGLDGGQILRWNGGNWRMQGLLGMVGMMIAGISALFFGLGVLYMLSAGKVQGAFLFAALVWGCLRVWAIAGDYCAQAKRARPN